jgi:protein O-mannosyl-transferase
MKLRDRADKPLASTALAAARRGALTRGFDRQFLAGCVLALAVLLAYSPCLTGQFVWDDDSWTLNLRPLFGSLSGLGRMWTDFTALQQYYPLTGSSFWIDYQLWGFRTFPYHVENVLLHLLSVLLFWRVLRRLQVPGAALAAGVLALHPMMVESVAWVTERKNVLSMVLFLGALLSYVRFTSLGGPPETPLNLVDGKQRRFWGFYFTALALYAASYLAKATVYAFPAVLLLLCWWKQGRLRWREDILPTVPFFGVSLSLGILISWLEWNHVGAKGPEWAISLPERFLIAGRAIWFYTGKLLCPAQVCFVYPKWHLDTRSLLQWLWPITAVGALILLWFQRHRFGRGPLVACLYFVGTALPVLGLLNGFWMRYSFVWDHLAYLPSLGLIALFSALLSVLGKKYLTEGIRVVAVGVLLLAFGTLTWLQAATYRNDETLWRDAVSKNSACWIGYNYLGGYAQVRGEAQESLAYYRKSVQVQPNKEAYYNLAKALAFQGQTDEAIRTYGEALRLRPDYAAIYVDLGTIRFSQGQIDEALRDFRKAVELSHGRAYPHWCLAATLQRAGRTQEAITHYREALRADPDMSRALENLATILASDPNPGMRDGPEAIRLAEHACQLTGYKEPHVVSVLSMAYAETGRYQDAASTAEVAAGLAEASGDLVGAKVNRELAQQYRSGKPYRQAETTNALPKQPAP